MSAKMQLVLNLQAPQEVVREKIKKVTEGHEVVDVNGFILKRRKVQNAENVPRNESNHLPMKTPCAPRLPGVGDGASYPSNGVGNESPMEEVFVDEQTYYRLFNDMQKLPATALPGDKLAILCNSVGASEVANCENSAVAGALQDVFALFEKEMRDAMTTGDIQLAEPSHDEGDADLHVDLESRKTALRARIAKFQQEEAEWHSLLDKINQLDCQGPETDGNAAEELAASPAVESSELAALRKLNQNIHRRLTTQVDGVCLMVGDVEELVAQANRSAHTMQADYHQEKFKTFPHVNSPAHLIKALIKGPSKA